MTPRYVMIGGFLGAGKTTAMIRLAERLTQDGLQVGLITNDQSGGLVDTAITRARGLPVEEIAGGCFCCRFNSLVEAAAKLNATVAPDVFLAEPVGSCTDLQATVTLPLRTIYGDEFSVAPFSVMIDPARAARVLGIEAGGSFTPKVLYVYRKQLEEAEILIINKIDVVDAERRARLRAALAREFPRAEILEVSARTGEGFDLWLDRLRNGDGSAAALNIDYDDYAEGEARLGWLNATARVVAPEADADGLLTSIASRIGADLTAGGIQIAHLKMTFTPDAGGGISVVNLVCNGTPPELAFALEAMAESGELTLNLRAEGEPARLESAARRAIAVDALPHGAQVIVRHVEAFRPSRPVPTHRLTAP
jgi:Ni2+-binding GTPase involved in maturation of urease and hydrogenase